MTYDAVTNENYVLYAAKHYSNCECESDDDFFADLKRIKYIKRLLKKYEESGDLKERLILNHIIVLFNLFGQEATVRLLFFKLTDYSSSLKPFLEYLQRCPEIVKGIGQPPKDLSIACIESNSEIVERLTRL
jgi:hypothetical protein